MRIGLVILPSDRWAEARRQWEWADRSGFSTAWTYDHIRWGGMPDGPWHAAVPVLAAAGAVTTRVRIGTLVATPNFRHPVTLAREALALDDVSGGRLDLGLGPGSEGPDATALGQDPWSRAERLERFEWFLHVLQPIVDGEPDARTSRQTVHYTADEAPSTPGALQRPLPLPSRRPQPIVDGEPDARTSRRTAHYTADEAPSTPGALQRPLPLTVAAGGAKGMRLVASYGRNWVTIGPTGRGPRSPAAVLEAVRGQLPLLDQACGAADRDPASVGKILLWTPPEPVIDSLDQFDELVAPYEELGFDQFVLHHPAQTGPYGGDVTVFEKIAERAATT